MQPLAQPVELAEDDDLEERQTLILPGGTLPITVPV
jgi:hypothetical protein